MIFKTFRKKKWRYIIFTVALLYFSDSYSSQILNYTPSSIEKRIDFLIYNGQITKAISTCDSEIGKLRSNSTLTLNIYKLFMLKAECYYQCELMENFKKYTDSALYYLNKSYPDTTIYHSMVFTNYARYYHYLIIPNVAKVWGELARHIYLKKKNEADKVDAFLIYQSIGAYTRNLPHSNAILSFDTAFMLYSKTHPIPDYLGAMLYRSYGNACMDRIVNYPSNLTSPYLQRCNIAFISGLKIIEKYYPDNLCEQVDFLDLLGLLNYFTHDYAVSDKFYKEAEMILDKIDQRDNNNPDFAVNYLETRNWHNFTLDKMCTPENKLQIDYQELENSTEAEKVFNNFAIKDIHSNSKSFRDIYNISPYQALVPLCYEIYSNTGDINVAYKALEYSEKGKIWNYYNTVILKDTSLKYNKSNTPPIDGKQIVNEIQSKLCDSCAVVEYSEQRQPGTCGLYAFVITQSKFQFFRLSIPDMENYKLFTDVLPDKKHTVSDYKFAYYRLYLLAFKPIETFLPKTISDITLVPTADLSTVSFDAMVRDTIQSDFLKMDYLFNHYYFHYLIYLSFTSKYNSTTPLINQSVFVYPQYLNKNLITLPNMGKYTVLWHNRLNGEFLTGVNLNKKNVLNSFKNKQLIHLTGHTLADVQNIDDFKFYLRDISDSSCTYLSEGDIINSKINADLVIYASCMSGYGEADINEGLNSFARAFIYAGAKSVLYSLFKADDKSTAFITNCFYENLLDGQPKQIALHNAKKKYLKQCQTSDEANPIYWAGLNILGNTNPVHLIIKSSYSYTAITGIILIMGILLFVLIKKYPSIQRRANKN